MKKSLKTFFDNRDSILKVLVYTVSIVFLTSLTKLQLIEGKEYREMSEKKMLRSSIIEAPRGEIYDRNGILLATNKLGFDLELYRTKVTSKQLNNILNRITSILIKNGDRINEPFSMEKNELIFYSEREKKNFEEIYNLKEKYAIKEVLEKLYKEYELEDFTEEDKFRILQIRYIIAKEGYSLFKSIGIASNISYESVIMLEEIKADIPGINIKVSPKRHYPNGSYVSHLLGYVGSITREEYESVKDIGYSYNSNIGKMGLEQSMEKYLKGKDGTLRTQVDSMGIANDEIVHKEAVTGKNITLTIDYRLQKVAEDSLQTVIYDVAHGLKGYKKSPEASSGSIVVLDINTAEVLAMASYPTFDPNDFIDGISYNKWKEINNNKTKPMFNRAITGTYSPGSTFKMLSGIAALESGHVTVEEKIQDTGVYKYGHNPKCWVYSAHGRTHGWVNVSEAIKVSCNCYFYEVGRRMGVEELVKYAKLFGLGSKTGIEVSGEVKGIIAGDNNVSKWYLGDTLSAVIGQSYNSYTPIQLANYIATLSNGGNLKRVSLVKGVEDNRDSKVSSDELLKHIEKYTGVKFKETNVELKKEHIDAITEGMKTVTSETGGTSYIVFKNSEIEVAGKTGTAQVTTGADNGLFVGFAPADKPEIAVVTVIENGGSGIYTASVVKAVMDEYFQISQKEIIGKTEQNIVKPGIKY
ncbi:MAG: penicillin-binding protein 2 [Clostridia bacterium]|nr:penicillin-binding protein 2 [Clostridia bacterium]MDD4375450.1 penicillin-binding protein 2 [Clostridia bacterium]